MLATRESKQSKTDNQSYGGIMFDGIERDLDKYTDKRVKELYKQTVLSYKATVKDCNQTTNNTQWMARKASWENERSIEAKKNTRKTGFESLKQIINSNDSKENRIPSSIYQKLKAKTQQPGIQFVNVLNCC